MQATPNSAVPAAYVPAPVGTPEFGASLGIQVTLFIAEGVQHAELHLNPSDMGPVSIRIALEGTATRVDFAAEQAATREAIERSLPELASALRDAGFTLSGGGVSTRHDGGGAAPDGNEEPRPGKHRADSGTAPFDAKGARRIATIKDGGIDVYA